jgi:hypothetical protein
MDGVSWKGQLSPYPHLISQGSQATLNIELVTEPDSYSTVHIPRPRSENLHGEQGFDHLSWGKQDAAITILLQPSPPRHMRRDEHIVGQTNVSSQMRRHEAIA